MGALGEAQRRLVRENVGLVGVHLKRSVAGVSARRCDREWDDLFQEGCLGLIRAAVEYQPSRGIPFAAFALPRIHTAVRQALLARPHAATGGALESASGTARCTRSARTDPNPPPRMRSTSRRAAQRLRDPRPSAPGDWPGETVGARLREKYERAVRRAAEEVLSRTSIRGDRDKLLRALAEERYLVPREDERRSYRKIAAQTQSSYARVVQCDRHLGNAIRRALNLDPEFAELQRVARTDPDGVDAPVDDALDRTLAQVGAAEFLARFRRADDARRAHLVGRLLRLSPDELERTIGSEIQRLPETLREQLHREWASETAGAAQRDPGERREG